MEIKNNNENRQSRSISNFEHKKKKIFLIKIFIKYKKVSFINSMFIAINFRLLKKNKAQLPIDSSFLRGIIDKEILKFSDLYLPLIQIVY